MANPLVSMGESRQKPKLPPKELDHIKLIEGEDGGHVVEHHFTSYEHKPESYPFGDSDGQKLIDHLKEHAHIKIGKE